MPIYMKYEGVKGDVTDAGFEGSFEILSMSWGVSNPGGNANLSDLNVMMSELQGTTRLMAACATGRISPRVRISFVSTGLPAREYMRYELENVLVSSYQVSGSTGAGLPMESLSLNFTKITYSIWYDNQKGGVTEQSDSASSSSPA